jgi:hypothetical protein
MVRMKNFVMLTSGEEEESAGKGSAGGPRLSAGNLYDSGTTLL